MKLTEENIIQILEQVFRQKKGQISVDTPLEDFAKDSMDIMEFIAILERKYGVTIVPTEMARLKDTREVIRYILSHQGNI
jgi:acyl carrier protein